MKSHPVRIWLGRLAALSVVVAGAAQGAINLQFAPITTSGGFTTQEVALLQEAVDRVEGMWETVLRGYQPGISVPAVPISLNATTSGLASATFNNTTSGGLNPANSQPFIVATGGFVNINVNEIENFADWQGPGANGLNFLDELIAHEVGHVLGIGTLWSSNGLYSFNYQYTGAYGTAAYDAEFTPPSGFVPVEDNGNAGTPHSHWDQRMRSSSGEGNPGDPWSLSPLVGVVDAYGRDRALELMTGAIDPDYGEPFLSRTTVESMRDLGYLVNAFEDFNGDGFVDTLDRDILQAHLGATGLQIDSIRYGDANRDRVVDQTDFALWQAAAGVPEPGAWLLAALGLSAMRFLAWRGT